MRFERLTNDNLMLYAVKAYDKPNFVQIDFDEDFKRIKYLQKLFYRYKEHGELKDRLILNHLIILNNVFGVEAASRILFFKIPEEYWSVLKTFLVFLSTAPKHLYGIGKATYVNVSDIPLDQGVIEVLRAI